MQINLSATDDQLKFIQMDKRYKAFVGGFGCGKTQTMAASAFMDSLVSSTSVIGLFSPTYDLLRLTIIPRILATLDENGVRYVYNKSDNRITVSTPGIGDFLFRTLDNPERIVGFEIATAHIDELDTLKTEHAEKAFNMVVARTRQKVPGNINKVSVYTTPEGFKFVYNRWVKDPTVEYGYVQASSRNNPFLPPDYVDSLVKNYPLPLQQAYIDGDFVNMTAGSVYTSYDINSNDSSETLLSTDKEIYVGVDFNVGKMSGVILSKRGNEYHAIDEIVNALDTPTLANILKDRYPNIDIICYPDAAGNHRSTQAGTDTDHLILQRAGIKVYVNGQNPLIKDRVNTVNNALEKKLLKINRNRCPHLSNGLIQQAYNNGVPDKSSGHDHANDALGYAVCYLMPIDKPTITKLKMSMF